MMKVACYIRRFLSHEKHVSVSVSVIVFSNCRVWDFLQQPDMSACRPTSLLSLFGRIKIDEALLAETDGAGCTT